MALTVTRSAADPAVMNQPSSVQCRTVDGTATASSGDYTVSAETVTFAANATTATCTVTVKTDGLYEAPPEEVFLVLLADPVGANLAATAGTVVY